MERKKVKTPEKRRKEKKEIVKNLKTEKQKKKKFLGAFTLIELLAVIIILGVLMIIAVPAVTKYINESRKSSYITTAKNTIEGARNLIHSGELDMMDNTTTYYIPAGYIKTENGLKSPYGELTEAYIGVVFNGDGYEYFWISNDSSGQGVKEIIKLDKLDSDSIEGNIKDTDIRSTIETTGINGRSKILILKTDGTWEAQRNAIDDTNGERNQYYLYYNDEYPINIGFTVEKGNGAYLFSGIDRGYERNYTSEHTFDNYQDAINDRTYWSNPSKPYNFFIRLKIVDNTINGMDLGYYLNNTLYYLKALNRNAYQTNRQKAIESFGIDKCEEHEYCSYTDNDELIGCDGAISCLIPSTSEDPGLYISIYEEGTLDAFDGNLGNSGWSCNIGTDWSWCLVPW